ncbi:hypothetical protein L0668_05090 [Paraglaciecola aquimarina]|uniref:Uncharacterized protein n=1 Tax=Paraglaciecola algarum TaxID=3050085 RepID=A0ABS9D3G0_9ALTE|nr:hypothetical protein [Paraglaciecola sp. G1-23]MCF2947472.1 hypothetical protein [Paraglaciecola sp. G1-23]
MDNVIEALKPYENDVDLPDDLRRDVKQHLENKFNECDVVSDDYDKYQAALDHVSKLGLRVPKGNPSVGFGGPTNEYFSTVRDLIDSLK